MYRSLIKNLVEWKNAPNRKPLILWGVRQVGKTYLMQQFGQEHFDNTLYISFYNNRKIAALFDEDYDVGRIINALEVLEHTKITKQKTLIIFDEVQTVPRVVESLKYFCEEAPEYAVIAAGSLLGVSIHQGISFPVGKVSELYLHPMSFSEYLYAVNEPRLATLLEDKTSSQELLSNLHETYLAHLKNYYFVGGMPEAVKTFAMTGDYDKVRAVQNNIISQYEGDFGKHVAAKELPRLRLVWHAIPVQLAKENKKFFFGQIKTGARLKEFEIAIQWLCDAGIIHKVNKVTKPAVPLKAYIQFSDFKLYLVDIGLLGALSELDKESIINGNEIFVEFKGSFAEQFVLQELTATTDYHLFYYSSEKSTYEMDFLFQQGSAVIPLEVKAEQNVKSKSLKVFFDKFKPPQAIRTSALCYEKQNWLTNFPLWQISWM